MIDVAAVLGVSIMMTALFLVVYLRDPRRVVNGFLFLLAAGTLFAAAFYFSFRFHLQVLTAILSVITVAAVALLLLASAILIIAGLINFIILNKKEGYNRSNLIVLAFTLVLIALNVIGLFQGRGLFSKNVNALIGYANMIVFYCVFIAVIYLLASLLCALYRPRHRADYIIVLGARLLDGVRVSKLLGSRVDAAIQFYHCQAKKRTPPKLIMSGGKGDDEHLSEAFAMQTYALTQEIPVEDTLLEEKSVNTYENMDFSRQIIEKRQQGKPYRVLYATNDFHLLRAGLYAKEVGMKAVGIKAKTAMYYWPKAMLREFAAYMVHIKRTNIIVFLLITVLYFTSFVLNKLVL